MRQENQRQLKELDRQIDELAMNLGSLQQVLQGKKFKPTIPYYYPQKEELAQRFEERERLQQAIQEAEEVLNGYLDPLTEKP